MTGDAVTVDHSMPHSPEVIHEPLARRFITTLDGVQAHLEYEPRQGVIAITHTIVPPAIGGRGIAGALVKTTVEYARGAGLKVLPACSYAEAWMRRHPEYADLRSL